MPISYTPFELQLAAALRIARKRNALIIEARDSDGATRDRRLYVAAGVLDTTDTQEAMINGALVDFHEKVEVPALQELFSRYRDKVFSIVDGIGNILKTDLALTPEELAFGLIGWTYDDRNKDGTVSILQRRGLLGALYRDMLTNTKSVTASVVSVASFAAGASTNVGLLTGTSLAGKQYCRPGTVRIECVGASVSVNEYRVTVTFTKPMANGEKEITGNLLLRAEKSWEDGPTGLTLTLTRSGLASPTETDPSSLIATSSFVNPRSADCDNGKFFFKFTRQASDVWLVEVFSDSSRTNKVGSPTVVPSGTTGTVVLTINCNDGTVITTTFSKANAHTAMPLVNDTLSNTELDIKNPRVGDFWTAAITNDGAGLCNEKLAEIAPAELPTSGAPTFTNGNFSSISIS